MNASRIVQLHGATTIVQLRAHGGEITDDISDPLQRVIQSNLGALLLNNNWLFLWNGDCHVETISS